LKVQYEFIKYGLDFFVFLDGNGENSSHALTKYYLKYKYNELIPDNCAIYSMNAKFNMC